MSERVSLETPGYVDLVEIVTTLSRGGCSSIDYRVLQSGDLDDADIRLSAVLILTPPGAPAGERREIRFHQSYHGSDKDTPYTYFSIGAHDEGPLVMRILAEGLGGRFSDDRDDSVQDFLVAEQG